MYLVAPLVGAWIEMAYSDKITGGFYVAPLVGAWIEIRVEVSTMFCEPSRSSRGSVD